MSPKLSRVSSLAVFLGDRRVGVINRLAGDRQLFAFDEAYIHDAERPTLSLAYKGQSGGVVTSVRPVSRRLPPFFSNLLPEGPLRTYLAEQAGVSPEREFFLLAVLGEDLPGAVVVRPLGEADVAEEPAHSGDDATDEAERGVLRFSLAGVQLKFSAVAEASGGLTIPAQGVGGSWIVKLPSLQFEAVPENEYAMLELARAVGITVPRIRLVAVAEIQGLPPDAARMHGQALAVERFDRTPDGARIHMEDFAQVFGAFPEAKYKGRSYANIAEVLWAEAGQDSVYELVRRLAFSVVVGNGDMHLKNWSLLYPDGRRPVLSPAYDFVSTLPYIAGDRLALSFGRSKSLDGITLDRVRRFAETARLPVRPVWEVARETVERTVEAWKGLGARDLLRAAIRRAVDEQIEGAAR